eukprot:m.163413 g.163413  ORF g.163413 m.163413 type:complete len:385 (+) comp12303_c0_seq1:140-1294(+)
MAAPRAPKLLVVGAGLTGSLLWRRLRTLVPQIDVEIWDKGSAPGGRASTTRRHGGQADLGMQYISTHQPDHAVYRELLDAGVIAPLTAKIAGNNPKYMDPSLSHFSVVEGTSALCKHLLHDAPMVKQYTVTGLHRITPAPETGDSSSPPSDAAAATTQWQVTTDDGAAHTFDRVVVTAPVPQVLGWDGVPDILAERGDDLGKRLAAVEYSSRWALAITLALDAWSDVAKLGWGAWYVPKDDSASVCYMAIDQLKRRGDAAGVGTEVGPTVVVHANVPWSLKTGAGTAKADETDDLRPRIEAEMLSEAKRLLPDVVNAHTVEWTKLHKWRYSQVYKGLGSDGATALHASPLLVLAGDGCTRTSGIDSCIQAAAQAAALCQVVSRI